MLGIDRQSREERDWCCVLRDRLIDRHSCCVMHIDRQRDRQIHRRLMLCYADRHIEQTEQIDSQIVMQDKQNTQIRETNNQKDKQLDREIHRQTDIDSCVTIERQVNRQTDRQIVRQLWRQINRLTED